MNQLDSKQVHGTLQRASLVRFTLITLRKQLGQTSYLAADLPRFYLYNSTMSLPPHIATVSLSALLELMQLRIREKLFGSK